MSLELEPDVSIIIPTHTERRRQSLVRTVRWLPLGRPDKLIRSRSARPADAANRADAAGPDRNG